MTIQESLDFFKKHKGTKIFTIKHFELLTGESGHNLKMSLFRLHRKKIVKRISRGFYANPFNLPAIEEISSQIYFPSYISLESALSFYGILSQIPQVTTCVTLNLPRMFKTNFGVIEYRQIKKDFFRNFVKKDGYFIAEPEKALLDYLYFNRAGTMKEKLAELNLRSFTKKKLIDYAEKAGMEKYIV
jgi:predicted transcriptional regulator of viral defense system